MCMNTSVCALCTVCIQVAHRRASLKSVPVCISWSCLRVHTPLPLRLVCVCVSFQSRSRPLARGTQTDPPSPELYTVTLHWTATYGAPTQQQGGEGRKEGRKATTTTQVHHTSPQILEGRDVIEHRSDQNLSLSD